MLCYIKLNVNNEVGKDLTLSLSETEAEGNIDVVYSSQSLTAGNIIEVNH